MPKITNDVKNNRSLLINKVLKSFSLVDLDDSSEIVYSTGESAYPTLVQLKEELIKNYPKRNTSRLRKGIEKKDLDSIRVLKELLRYYNMSLLSTRQQTKSGVIYKYKIVR